MTIFNYKFKAVYEAGPICKPELWEVRDEIIEVRDFTLEDAICQVSEELVYGFDSHFILLELVSATYVTQEELDKAEELLFFEASDDVRERVAEWEEEEA